MRYSVEPREAIEDRIYAKGYGFLSFAKIMGKNLSNKNSQKLLDSVKKFTTDAIKIYTKQLIQKTAEATIDLTGNEIAEKITSLSKYPTRSKNDDVNSISTRYISPEERQQVIDELRLV